MIFLIMRLRGRHPGALGVGDLVLARQPAQDQARLLQLMRGHRHRHVVARVERQVLGLSGHRSLPSTGGEVLMEISASEYLMVISRIEAIEARQRDHHMHDPDCSVRQAQRANARGGMYYYPGTCTCWLAPPDPNVPNPHPPGKVTSP